MPVESNPFQAPADLTIATAEELRGRFLDLLHGGPAVLDLSGVETCDAAGLQLLCALRKSAGERSIPLSVVEPSVAVVETAGALGISTETWADGGADDAL